MRTARKVIAEHAPELIISSSPPPTVHLIARKLKRRYKLPWIADLRDPWTDIYSMQLSAKNRFTRAYELSLEKKVLSAADQITTVSRVLAEKFAQKTGSAKTTHVIPNGYDPDDFTGSESSSAPQKFIILHAGKLSSEQYPERLFIALERMTGTVNGFKDTFEFVFVGHIAPGIRARLAQSGLNPYIREVGYVDHHMAIGYMKSAALNLLVIPDTPDNRGIITGKVFEYLASRRPVLCIGPPDSDLSEIFTITSGGEICAFDEDPEPRIKKYYDLWKRNELPATPVESIRPFSRKELTGKLVGLFPD